MRNDLRFTWPYAASHVNASLDPDLIEKHGIDRISRALDIGHVVAFLGSGTSMSYGRASWQGLVDHLRDDVVRKFEQNFKGPHAKDVPPDIRSLKTTLDTVGQRGDDALASERYPILFQITEQLNEMLVEEARKNPAAQKKKLENKFREHTQRLAYDDREHAKHLIRSALNLEFSEDPPEKLANGEEPPEPSVAERFAAERWRDTEGDCGEQPQFQRDFPTPDHDPKNYYWYLRFFECETAVLLAKEVEQALGRASRDESRPEHKIGCFANLLGELAERTGQSRSHLHPLHRFIIPCLSLLHSQPTDAVTVPAAFDRVRLPDDKSDAGTDKKNRIERRSLIPYYRDPIALLSQELRIHRFLTTNFDMEIERMFDALGYRFRGKTDTDDRMNELELRARDFAFTNEKADLLIDFATQDQSVEYQACHVHGRAIKGEENSLVVTEQDYNKVYIRGDETRDLVDESIKLAFGSSPLLFVGQGMSEEDLLRPLRHFMSDNRLPPERLAVALLPGSKSKEERQRDTISFFVRYRVYAVHSGSACYKIGTEGGTKESEIDPDWLATVVARKKVMLEYIDCLREAYDVPGSRNAASRAVAERFLAAKRAATIMAELIPGDSTPEVRAIPMGLTSDRKLQSDIARLDGIPAEGELDVRIEIEILNAVQSILIWEFTKSHKAALEKITPQTPPGISTDHDFLRRLRSLQMAIEGATDALMSVSICAKILSVSQERKDWRDRWRRQPSERSVEFSPPFGRPVEAIPIFRVRHRIDPPQRFNPLDPVRAEDGPGPARMFRSFIRELKGGGGRRIFLVVGGHGAGKGHFFTLFQRKELFEEFCRAQGLGPESYGAVIFANLSYSAEVASVWDGINRYVGEHIKLERRGEDYLSRLDKLDKALKKICSEELSSKRVLIALNAVDILFDGDGYPKNAHVRRTFDILLDDRYEGAPLDLVFVTDEQRIPIYFRMTESGTQEVAAVVGRLPQTHAEPAVKERLSVLERAWGAELPRIEFTLALHKRDDDVAMREIAARVERFRINLREDESSKRRLKRNGMAVSAGVAGAVDAESAKTPRVPSRPPANFLYYLRGPHVLEHAANYFPTLLVLLGLGGWGNSEWADLALLRRLKWEEIEACGLAFQKLVHAKIVAWGKDKEGRIALKSDKKEIREFLDRVHPSHEMIYPVILFRILISDPSIWNLMATTEKIRLVDMFTSELSERLEQALVEVETALRGGALADGEGGLLAEIERFASRCWSVSEALRRALERNRFCMTIFLRAAEELCKFESRSGGLDTVFLKVHNWMETTVQAVARADETRRDEAILGEVLRLYEVLAGRDSPSARDRALAARTSAKPSRAAEHRLQLSLLLHIAVIGQPIEADVLAVCPDIRRLVQDIYGPLEDGQIVDRVWGQLQQLLDRHLIFQIGVDPRLKRGGDEKHLRRYALHRIVSRHALRRLEGPLIDFSQVDFFALSLYSIQQRDIARPTAQGYRFLRDLLTALIGYPTANQSAEEGGQVFAGERSALIGRRLRAAYGIVRTVFSVVVVSRFIELDFLDEKGPDQGGYFEEHRLLVRWMLRLARDLDDRMGRLERKKQTEERRLSELDKQIRAAEKDSSKRRNLGEEIDEVNGRLERIKGDITKAEFVPPFFREQILWIHNECAMFSLVQGRMHDATAHFDLALSCAANIEGRRSEGGALDARLRLNRAVAEIDRGNGRAHIPALNKIVETADEHPVIRASARGWIGVIERLSGDQSSARASLEQAIKELEVLGQLRGASIFHRNLGILDRNMKLDNDARRHFRQAQALAEAGGHEDIRQYALLEVIRAEGKADGRQFRPGTLTQLHSIEKYARVMGIPRLESDVYRSRGYLLLHQGETKLAGALAEKAVEIATLNGLTLRKIAAMILLGETYYERDHHRACRTLLARAIELARRANYQEAVDRAEIALARAHQ
jgi:tetratricopeptide (TPR) repeat protein